MAAWKKSLSFATRTLAGTRSRRHTAGSTSASVMRSRKTPWPEGVAKLRGVQRGGHRLGLRDLLADRLRRVRALNGHLGGVREAGAAHLDLDVPDGLLVRDQEEEQTERKQQHGEHERP